LELAAFGRLGFLLQVFQLIEITEPRLLLLRLPPCLLNWMTVSRGSDGSLLNPSQLLAAAFMSPEACRRRACGTLFHKFFALAVESLGANSLLRDGWDPAQCLLRRLSKPASRIMQIARALDQRSRRVLRISGCGRRVDGLCGSVQPLFKITFPEIRPSVKRCPLHGRS
jgi:hypothetical protein